MAGEGTPASVPGTARQGGDMRARWAWVEPSVWTERMLEALEQGVRGGKWFSLIDKVGARRTLEAAWQQVRRNRGAGGIDGVSIERFAASAERILAGLESEMKGGVMEDGELREVESGTPQGGVISPLLANIYLHPVDVVLHQAGYESVRYADA